MCVSFIVSFSYTILFGFFKFSLISFTLKVYLLAFCNIPIFPTYWLFSSFVIKHLVSVLCFSWEVMKENAWLVWEVFWETERLKFLQSDDFFSIFFLLKTVWRDSCRAWILVKIHILFFWIGTISNTYLKLWLEQLPFPRKEVESYYFVTYST